MKRVDNNMKILVDELPNSCSKCLFLGGVNNHNHTGCTLLKIKIPMMIGVTTKLGNCPLDVNMTEVEITNSQLAWIEANKSMGFECPECKHTQIVKAWNYIHNYCPHCGVKIIWNLSL